MKKEKNDVCISTILDDADVFLLLEKNVAVTKMKTFVELGKKNRQIVFSILLCHKILIRDAF